MSIDPGAPKRHALGIDFGTSNTVAVARWPDGRARPILVDGSPLLPSAVYAEPDGELIAGRDAVHSARLDPARFEPNPKRRVDDGLVLLGDREFPVVELIAAVLSRVAEEWRRAAGPVPTEVTLTCPATWGASRRTLLADAATRAGLSDARLVAEPVAAATYFAEVLGRDVPIGSVVVVHDFGAGTFDASVVARTAEGFEVLAVDGRDDIGGLDVDAAIVEHVGRTLGDDGAATWKRLTEPSTLEERRAQRQLWDDVRIAKERLSRYQSADFVLPLMDREIHLTRDELEELARPVLDQTVQVTKRLLRWADLPDGRLAGVFLVGGASRIPLVATLLHRELGEAPVVIEQPELVVAEGSILADAALLATGAAAPGPTAELRLVFDRRDEVRVKPKNDEIRAGATNQARSADVAAGSRPLAAAGLNGVASVDDLETVRNDSSHIIPPAVDPWPDAAPPRWEPDMEQTVATDPTWRPDPVRQVSPAPSPPRPAPQNKPPRRQQPPAAPRPQAARPQAARPQAARPQATRPQATRPPVSRPAPPPKKRRRGGFARFLQVLISIALLIAAPLAALVFAYSYGTGEPLTDAFWELTDRVRDFIDTRIL
jgi:actin-like ATPase involved in cell morphogenesis